MEQRLGKDPRVSQICSRLDAIAKKERNKQQQQTTESHFHDFKSSDISRRREKYHRKFPRLTGGLFLAAYVEEEAPYFITILHCIPFKTCALFSKKKKKREKKNPLNSKVKSLSVMSTWKVGKE